MKKIIFAIAVAGITLVALAQTTQQRGEVQTSRFSREALTNETAAGWRTKLGVGTGGDSSTNYNLATSTNLPYAGLSDAARQSVTNVAERAALNTTNNFNGRNIADGTISTNEIDATFRSWVTSMATGTNAGGGGIVSNYIIPSMAAGVWYTNDTEYTALLLLSLNFNQVGDAESGVWFQLDTSGGNTSEYQTQYLYDDHDAAVNKDMTARLAQYIPAGATFHFEDISVGGSTVNIGGSNTDDNRLVYFGSGGGGGIGVIEDGSISTNKINSTFYNWVLAQAGSSMSAAEFSARLATNAIDAANITGDLSVDNLTVGSLTATSIGGAGIVNAFSSISQTNQNIYNIIDYGALTNAHKALQICLDKAGTNNGGGNVCFIPAGNWYITNSSFYPTLSSENLESMLVIIGTNTIVRGVGPASKIIVDLGVLASRNVFGSGDSVASGGGRVNWAGTKNATFMHFTLDSQLNGGDQTQMYGGHTFNFLNVRSLNSGADFIDTESLTTTAIGCYVSNAIGSAFQTKPATSETAHGIIADCWFEDSSSAATAPTIQVLNNVAILCSNTKIGGSKNIYTMGSFAGGQFSFDNCYFYPTNGGQAPMIIVNAVGGFTDCIFYGTGSTTASNYVYATNSNLQFANSTFYSKDGLLGHDVKALVMGNRFVNGATAAITLRGTSSSPWGSLITGNTFAGGSAAALDSSVSFLRFDGNTTTDRNVLITGGTNSIIANNTMIGTASTRISSANFNEIRGNIMPVNSGSVHSIMLTGANSNSIAGNKLGKLTFNTACYGNELTDNRIESFAYIGGASAGNSLNTGTRLRNTTWTNTFLESSFSDGASLTNLLRSTNYVAANFAPTAGYIKFVGSNNALYAVSDTKTNLISAP